MARLSLSFLGPFQVTLDTQAVSRFESNKIRALLIYLAVESARPHPREVLAGLLWPDWPDRSALSNLRHALASLRQAIGDPQAEPPLLLISRETVQFNAESDHELDVALFSALLAQDAAEGAEAERLERAVALHRGAFLEGFSVSDAAPFEEWATRKREGLREELLSALERLGGCYEERGDYSQAVRSARRELELDPLREEAQRALMRALALAGQRSAALEQYAACCRTLRVELGVEPAPQTTALYESIRAGTLASPSGLPGTSLEPALQVEEGALEAPRPLFVAREAELERLGRFLEAALEGQGRVAFVTGEAGSGKTALVQEFERQAMESHGDLVVASGSCNAYTGIGDPYLPFLEILQTLSGDIEAKRAGGTITHEHARRLYSLFPSAIQALLDAGPELVDLLIPGAALLARAQALAPAGAPWRTRLEELLRRKAASPAPSSLQQAALFERYTRVLQALARERLLLLALDDLQWADAGSLSLLFHLGRRLAGSRILVVGTYRPEEVALGREGERHPLEAVVNEFRGMWGEMRVDLGQAEGQGFVEALVDSEPNALGVAFREALYQHTGGQALFTVEVLRGLQERGDLLRDEAGRWVVGPSLDWGALPARVEAAISEHIGRLPEELQELLAVASVEGEEFTAEAVARVRGAREEEVIHHLGGALSKQHRLVGATGVRRVGEQRLSRYRFRHFLFQHYLYQRLDEVERAHLHEAMGNALEALYGATPRTVVTLMRILKWDEDATSAWRAAYLGLAGEAAAMAPQLARHFQAAGLTEKAVSYLQQAAERAGRILAYEEAIAHLTRGLSLLQELPDTLERALADWGLQQDLVDVVTTIRGEASPERRRACARAYELAQRIGEGRLIYQALANLAIYHRCRAELRVALQLEEQMLDLAQRELPPRLADAHIWLGHSLCRCGQFAAARWHLEQAGGDWRALDHLAYALWYMGYPDQALRASQDALALAQESNPGAVAWVLFESGSVLHQLRREVRATLEAIEALLPLTVKEAPSRRYAATILLGWIHAQSGQAEQGIAEMRQGLAAFEAQGSVLTRSQLLALLAEGYALAGRAEEGLGAIAEALEHVERTEERYYEAEVHRLKGELLLQRGLSGAETEAEACFQKGTEVARRQEARSWELRATMSLARLWQSQGKREEARQALAAIYGWFSEGSDTPDLQEAKALLEELQRAY